MDMFENSDLLRLDTISGIRKRFRNLHMCFTVHFLIFPVLKLDFWPAEHPMVGHPRSYDLGWSAELDIARQTAETVESMRNLEIGRRVAVILSYCWCARESK